MELLSTAGESHCARTLRTADSLCGLKDGRARQTGGSGSDDGGSGGCLPPSAGSGAEAGAAGPRRRPGCARCWPPAGLVRLWRVDEPGGGGGDSGGEACRRIAGPYGHAAAGKVWPLAGRAPQHAF